MMRLLFQTDLSREQENDGISIHGSSRRKKIIVNADSSSMHTGTVPSRDLAIGSSIHVRVVYKNVVENTQINQEPNRLDGNNDVDQSSLMKIQAHACEMARKQYDGDLRVNGIRDYASRFPSFSRKEVLEGRYLGRGSTCVVAQINGFRPCPENGSAASSLPDHEKVENAEGEISTKSYHSLSFSGAMLSNKEAGRNFVMKNCYRESGDSRYVIKQLQKRVINDPKKLLQGLADLNLETKFLSSLPHHPNIIKLRAIADGDRFHPDYFLVLDRLFDTLEQRIVQWRAKAKKLDVAENYFRSLMTRLHKPSTETVRILEERARLLHDQVWTAYDLSSAIAHLHKHGVMHRDIKPSNIGFDIRNDVKIFDFGLGKEIPRSHTETATHHDTTRETWRLTAMVGTPRYMAPEVALGLPYNESCDVYSFGIVLWQIMTLNTKTYGNSNRNNAIEFFVKNVWEGPQKRPSMILKSRTVRRNFLPCLQKLIPSCWSHDWQSRPTMAQVESALRDEVLQGSMVSGGYTLLEKEDAGSTSHGTVPQASNKQRPTLGPKTLSAAFLHRMGKVCKRTRSERSFFGVISKKQTTRQTKINHPSCPEDQPRGLFYEQDLVSLSCPMVQRRRLTHQSRRSTFCLDMEACAKALQRDATEYSIDFSDDFDFDFDEDEDSVVGGKHNEKKDS